MLFYKNHSAWYSKNNTDRTILSLLGFLMLWGIGVFCSCVGIRDYSYGSIGTEFSYIPKPLCSNESITETHLSAAACVSGTYAERDFNSHVRLCIDQSIATPLFDFTYALSGFTGMYTVGSESNGIPLWYFGSSMNASCQFKLPWEWITVRLLGIQLGCTFEYGSFYSYRLPLGQANTALSPFTVNAALISEVEYPLDSNQSLGVTWMVGNSISSFSPNDSALGNNFNLILGSHFYWKTKQFTVYTQLIAAAPVQYLPISLGFSWKLF